MLKVKGGLFLLKLEIRCICRNLISAKNKKMLIPVSDVGVSAVYDLANVFYFFRMLFRNYNILPMNK